MRQAAALALAGLFLVALPPSARSETSDAIGGGAALAAGMGMLCWGMTVREGDVEPGEFDRRGIYVGASGTYGAQLFESDVESKLQRRNGGSGSSLTLSQKGSFGFRARTGWRCHKRLAAEVQVEWLDEFKGNVFSDAGGVKIGEVKIRPVLTTVVGKGYILTGRIQPFLSFGGGAAHTKKRVRSSNVPGFPLQQETDTDIDFVVRGGGGVDFYATENVVLTLDSDYVHPFGSQEDFDFISIGMGVQYRF